MKILYIFPHPDDESFGPVGAINIQLKEGHEAHLLTLTKGGATKQRHRLGLTIDEMGEVRHKEMLEVEKTLGLTSMVVWDYPDSGLKEMDPRVLEKAIAAYIEELKPEIIVSYPVHGISGFHDHLIAHAVVKRVFLEMKEQGHDYLKRLAFITIRDNGAPTFLDGKIRLKHTEEELLDCIVQLQDEDVEMLKSCLSCYATYKSTIEESGVIKAIGNQVYFEFFNEDCTPPVGAITDNISE
jgi:LmbE family N-acetylglucosaminyl deacetylase